jgi:nitrogen fixation/metabolism regulation signal transduction histidine kinase
MVFKHFLLGLTVRVGLLLLTLVALSAVLVAPGYYVLMLVLAVVCGFEVVELYRYVSTTNTELTRFLAAARHRDSGQQFLAEHASAGFGPLSAQFTQILQQLEQHQASQQTRLMRLQLLAEHIPVPLMSLFADGKIQLHNIAARQLFSTVEVTKVEDLAAFGETFVATMSHLEVGKRQLALFTHDGLTVQLTVLMTQLTSGSSAEQLISLQDIQSELDSAQFDAWQSLTQVLTHEIMNSITPVASLANTSILLVDETVEKLQSDGDVAQAIVDLADIRKAVGTVARRSNSLTQFVQSYRSVTELPQPQKQRLELKPLLAGIESLLSSQWRSLDVTLTVTVEPASLQLSADSDLLQQVLINLLTNAAQALVDTPQPQVILSARLTLRGQITIEVADNGPGISPDIATQVFIPFYTTKRDGSGVGLALTRQVMIAHGGTVTVGRSSQGGARFSLIF